MSTAVQRRRGTTAQHTTFTGALGEVTIDTTKKTAVVHDGATIGGVPLAREDLNNVDNAVIKQKAGLSTFGLGSLVDVDLETTAPEIGDTVVYDGEKFVPNPGGAGEPVGRIALLMGPTPDDGWLAFGEGGTYSTAAFPDLAAWMAVNFPGQAAGTFPDWRDYSPRTAGGALGPALRAKQEDAFQGHQHTANGFTSGAAVALGSSFAGGAPTGNPITDGTNGTPRIAAETRVKSFGVRWQIKAAGALSNPGAADMAVISVIASNAVRRDIDQGAQAFSAPQKVNLLKNTLQAWEQIGSEIVVGAVVALVGWTELSAYKYLRLHLTFKPTVNDAYLQLQVGAGAADTGTSYFAQRLTGRAASVSASVGTSGSSLAITSETGAAYEAISTVALMDFNKTRPMRLTSTNSAINSTIQMDAQVCSGRHGANTALDLVRLTANTGNIGVNSAFILEGIRG